MKQKPYEAVFKKGVISIEQNLNIGCYRGIIDIKVSEDGSFWLNMNGKAIIRFKPIPDEFLEKMLDNKEVKCPFCKEIHFNGTIHTCKKEEI